MRAFSIASLGFVFGTVVLGGLGCSSSNASGSKGTPLADSGSSPGTLSDGGMGSLLGGGVGCAPSPANYEVPGDGCDNDGDGMIDNVATCDAKLPVTGGADLFAATLGICQTVTGAEDVRWGIVSVTYKGAFSTGSPVSDLQHGILPAFGSVLVPREGSMLGILSTGWARDYDNSDSDTPNPMTPFKGGFAAQPGDPKDDAPPGFPKAAAGCPIDSTVHDYIEESIVLKVPANAKGFSFDFDFWSGEWPEYVCSAYNDSFVAYVTNGDGTSNNVSFDAQNNPVSVNNGFLDRCTPDTPTGCNVPDGPHVTSACASGETELAGTGFGAPRAVYCTDISSPGASTGWLTSTSPVQPGDTITLELMIWDTGDQNYDSTVLLDHFQWVAAVTTVGTGRPPK